jgi:hypothetical protein
MLAAVFGPITHTPVAAGRVAAFLIGTTTLITVIGATLAAIIAIRSADWRTLLAVARPARWASARA